MRTPLRLISLSAISLFGLHFLSYYWLVEVWSDASLMSRGFEWPAYKLSRWLFSRVLASHSGGPGPSPGRDMSVVTPT